MALDLSGVQAKIKRAFEHLQVLDAEIEAWAHSYPYGLREEKRDEGRERVGLLEIYSRPTDPRFGLLIGDIAHNFRSALDQLAYAVSIDGLRAKGLPTKEFAKAEGRIAFPICTVRDAWTTALAQGKLEGASGGVLAKIERHQPLHADDPTTHDLHVLHWLNNRDKHRLLHAVAAFPEIQALNFIPELPGPSEGRIFPAPGPYDDGAEVYTIKTPESSADVDMTCELLVQIRIGDAPVSEEVRETFPKLGQTIQRIISDVAKAHDIEAVD
jgi:hypothetical protein